MDRLIASIILVCLMLLVGCGAPPQDVKDKALEAMQGIFIKSPLEEFGNLRIIAITKNEVTDARKLDGIQEKWLITAEYLVRKKGTDEWYKDRNLIIIIRQNGALVPTVYASQ